VAGGQLAEEFVKGPRPESVQLRDITLNRSARRSTGAAIVGTGLRSATGRVMSGDVELG
jgi:hypothetical protein